MVIKCPHDTQRIRISLQNHQGMAGLWLFDSLLPGETGTPDISFKKIERDLLLCCAASGTWFLGDVNLTPYLSTEFTWEVQSKIQKVNHTQQNSWCYFMHEEFCPKICQILLAKIKGCCFILCVCNLQRTQLLLFFKHSVIKWGICCKTKWEESTII